jgi:hypothetical protein
VQWLAVAPDPALGVLGGAETRGDGDQINFPVPFARPPVVVTNACIGDRAVVSGVAARDATGFILSVRDVDGQRRGAAQVTWLAVDPTVNLAFAAGEGAGVNGAQVAVAPPLRGDPAYVLSAAPAAPAAAVDNRRDGFRLALESPVPDAPPAIVQWIGFAGPPTVAAETSAVMPGARLIIRARWQAAVPPEATLPVCFRLADRPDGTASFAQACATAGAPAVALRLPALAAGSTIWIVEEPPPGWTAATPQPAPFAVPNPDETREVTFTNVPIRPGPGTPAPVPPG